MLLVVGDVMTDVIVRPDGPLARGTDTPAEITLRPGGSGANIACWLGQLGATVTFAGRVGAADAAAHAAAMRAHGVRPHLAADPARETGRTVAIVEPDGERSFYTDRAANLALAAADLPAALLDGCTLLHVSGHTLAADGPRAAVLLLLREAAARGCPVSADAGSAAYLRARGPGLLAGLPDLTLLFANADEACLLGALPPPATLVVTERTGARAIRKGAILARVSARPVSVRDGIGAGDAFTAGFLHAFHAGAPTQACLQRGAEVAAMALAHPGGRPEAPVEARAEARAEGLA